jgi:hypothetical protein
VVEGNVCSSDARSYHLFVAVYASVCVVLMTCM